MRVVQLIGGLNPDGGGGGGELYGLRVAAALAQRAVPTTLATVWWRGTAAEQRWADQLRAAGVQVLPGVAPGARVATDLLRAARHHAPALRSRHADLLHSHVEYADLCALLLRLGGAVRCWLRSAHNPREFSTQPAAARLSRLLYPLLCRAEAAVIPEIVAQLDRRPTARLLRRRAQWIANGVDAASVQPQRGRAEVRVELGIGADVPLLICVARLAPQKGIERLAAALATLRQQLPAELLLVGSGPQLPQLQHRFAAAGLAQAVHLLGARSDVADLLAAADLAVLPSRWEGLPTVVLEAALLGVPQVVADLPGTRLLITDGISGRLVDAADAQQLAQALVQQLTDRQAARRMAEAARQAAAAFSLQASVDALLPWYRAAIGRS